MTTPFEPLDDPVTRAAVATFAGHGRPTVSAIDPRDEMFRYNRGLLYGNATCAATLYFLQGWQIATTVREVATQVFGGLDRLDAMLDFGSGYGRATRFLVDDLDPTRLWVSDIVAEAVAFQEDRLGVHGIVSCADPDDLAIDRRFDYIFVSSLFSHLPSSTFGRWLDRLVSLLTPNGLLAFSVLDGRLQGEALAPDGLRFHPESESETLPGAQYGTTYVTDGFVRAQIAAAASTSEVHHVPAGLCGHQDLYLIRPRSAGGLGWSTDSLTPFPRGELDVLEAVDDDTVTIGGWAGFPGTDEPVASVSMWTADRQWEANLEPADEPGRCRWRATVDRRRTSLDEVVMVVAHGRTGVASPIALGTLRPFLAVR